MDFFAREDQARRSTRRLLGMFLFCVVAMVGVITMLTWWGAGLDPRLAGLRGELALWAALGTGATILIASLYKRASLASGGEAVASLIGARLLSPSPSDPLEQQFHHVVEEMSIASGTPLPLMYVLDDPAINAFAAGHTPSDSAIVVTRGTLERLSRDELQGVVAHEFSHLLNGDTRLNLKLIGWAFGLLVVALAGRMVVSNINLAAAAGSSRQDRKSGGGGAVVLILAIGLALMAVGYIGYFFAQLLKAGVSRQREFLADASAVQFTRNPGGIGGALKKIGLHSYRSLITDHHAVELSHMFFADGAPIPFIGLFATHPPLEARIRAIDPAWDGAWTEVAPIHPSTRSLGVQVDPALSQHAAGPTIAGHAARFSPDHVAFSAALLGTIPPELMSSSRVPFSARAVALLVALEAAGERSSAQLQMLEQLDPQLATECRQLMPRILALGPGARLPLLNLCMPALRQLSPAQKEAFIALERQLAGAGGSEPPLGEYVLMRMLRARLSPPPLPAGGGLLSLQPVLPAVRVVLGELAWVGAGSQAEAERACAAAVERLGEDITLTLSSTRATASELDAAFAVLVQAGPGLRRRLLNAFSYCVSADGKVTVLEAEMIRAVADILGCPLPPFLDATSRDGQAA